MMAVKSSTSKTASHSHPPPSAVTGLHQQTDRRDRWSTERAFCSRSTLPSALAHGHVPAPSARGYCFATSYLPTLAIAETRMPWRICTWYMATIRGRGAASLCHESWSRRCIYKPQCRWLERHGPFGNSRSCRRNGGTIHTIYKRLLWKSCILLVCCFASPTARKFCRSLPLVSTSVSTRISIYFAH